MKIRFLIVGLCEFESIITSSQKLIIIMSIIIEGYKPFPTSIHLFHGLSLFFLNLACISCLLLEWDLCPFISIVLFILMVFLPCRGGEACIYQ